VQLDGVAALAAAEAVEETLLCSGQSPLLRRPRLERRVCSSAMTTMSIAWRTAATSWGVRWTWPIDIGWRDPARPDAPSPASAVPPLLLPTPGLLAQG
jgi:hypothetical protein